MAIHNTLQDVFNVIWQKFVVKGAPQSRHQSGGCAYRDPNGNACFVGCCIPDEEYYPEMEGRYARTLAESDPDLWERVFNGITADNMCVLQRIHDRWSAGSYGDWGVWLRRELRAFAANNNLRVPVEVSE